MSSFHVQPVSEEPVDWGESPHWDESRQRLSYVDCFAKCIHQIDPESGKCDRFTIMSATNRSTPMTTMAIPVTANDQSEPEFLITLGNSIAKYSPASGDILKLADIESGSYFNNGKCDSGGRLWVGSFTGIVRLIIECVLCCNKSNFLSECVSESICAHNLLFVLMNR
jgi:sugar lactone lactonase YvrE